MKDIIIGILIVLLLICLIYILFINIQINSINKQITLKLKEKNRRPITVQLTDKRMINLAKNINEALSNEENIKLEVIKNENEFKEMIANISHDLRTPLTAVKGYQQLIELDELSKEQKEKLEIAMKHTDELGDLIEHFFEYSRLINSRPKADIQKINITNLIVECIIMVIPQFEKRNIKINFDDSRVLYVSADLEFMKRIIINLLGNALKYSAGDVDISITENGKFIRLQVKNKAENLKKEDEDKIFKRFYSLDSSRNRSQGLGLSIVKLLAEEMDGKVYATIDKDMISIFAEIPV